MTAAGFQIPTPAKSPAFPKFFVSMLRQAFQTNRKSKIDAVSITTMYAIRA